MGCLTTVVETPRSYALGRLSPHQVMALRSRLAECESYKRGSGTGAERRREVRVPTDEAAQMKVLRPLDDTQESTTKESPAKEIRVLDISRNGLKISLPEVLLPGTILQIHMRAALTFAEVRYCTPCGEQFHAGVRFQDVFWTNTTK